MKASVVRRFVFTVTFPYGEGRRQHVPKVKLRSLLKRQLSDVEVIETIDHLFRCHRCLENYRYLRSSLQASSKREVASGVR